MSTIFSDDEEDTGHNSVLHELYQMEKDNVIAQIRRSFPEYVASRGVPLLEHFDLDAWESLLDQMMVTIREDPQKKKQKKRKKAQQQTSLPWLDDAS
jgi:hypothetical protein